MALKAEDNELLTRVGPGTAMGRMLRQYWTPAVRSNALIADGAPVVVRLFGQDYLAFRATDGSVGFVDEACPHRGVSLALARNEENGLRCIFHGWKFDTSGRLVDAPAEPAARREKFQATVKTSKYATREAAGVLWVFVGEGEVPPFPEFEFMDLPPEQVFIRRAVVPYNWLQGLEAHLDSSHVGFLHSGWAKQDTEHTEKKQREMINKMLQDNAPRFEMDDTSYGMREGALRDLGEGITYARIREVVLPFHTFIPSPPNAHNSSRISVPIDDETSAEWYVLYNSERPLDPAIIKAFFFNTADDPDNFAANLGDKSTRWDQDRAAMKKGHFSGLTKNLSFEDFIVQASMGRRFDRSKEQLGSADAIVVKVRRLLLEAVKAFDAGAPAPWNSRDIDYPSIRARSVEFDAGKSWREFAHGKSGKETRTESLAR
jgi:phthalate 4,5-dioxygenase oxygenase subunit